MKLAVLVVSTGLLFTKECSAKSGSESGYFQTKTHHMNACSASVSTDQCSERPSTTPETMALVLYNEESIVPIHKPQREFEFMGRRFIIPQDWTRLGVAAVVWDAAVVLCEYLSQHQQLVSGRRVLELGAGTGLAGMVAAVAGGIVTVTERAEALQHLGAAVQSNMGNSEHNIIVRELDWTHDHRDFPVDHDVILGADIIYVQDTFPDLLRTLLHFTKPETEVLLSCKIRYERDSSFLSMMKEHFTVKKIFFDSQRDIHMYAAQRKT